MPHYDYFIIGGGMTADAAAQGIREVDSNGSIGLISMETNPPYDRPPLTKGLWKDKKLESIWRKTKERKVNIHLGRRIEAVDVDRKRAIDDQRNVYTFNKLLLATGGTPRRLPFGGEDIIYYRTVVDYQNLRKLTENGRRFAVIGGGFIGSEISAALAMNQKQVVLVFPGKTICSRVFPGDLGESVTAYYRQKGVEVLAGETASDLQKRDGKSVLKTKSGKEITVDGVIAGLGIEPNVELARMLGAKVGDGVEVDELLQMIPPDFFAAGDVASFHNPALGKRIRVEHEDNANTMGRAAGRNMAGRAEPYHHLPFFYSDLFDLGYEAVGDLDARLQTFSDWKDPFREGVVYYLKDGRVRGVLLWNVWGQVDAARKLIAEPGPFRPEDLNGKLPKS
ncbi:MAG TPA: FAD-dependent oxidoreductase [Verrucomicrobiae bacterium]|nr:FAD-dependent oxidoreductase [Verrucomicrobiae bacterium]